jgi:hypothetical protein
MIMATPPTFMGMIQPVRALRLIGSDDGNK